MMLCHGKINYYDKSVKNNDFRHYYLKKRLSHFVNKKIIVLFHLLFSRIIALS